jgi:hypothetical protein
MAAVMSLNVGKGWLPVAALAAVVALLASGCGAIDSLTGDDSAKIASATGASQCTGTDYDITNRLDSSKARIYDCTIDGVEKCVTYENGIARDETETSKLLFAQNLSGGRPDCAR